MRPHLVLTFVALAGFALFAGCYTGGGGRPPGPPQTMSGVVIDGESKLPLAGSIVIVEVGGLYQPNEDTSKGNPFYRFSAVTGLDGSFSVTVPGEPVGLHTFQNGYYYGVLGPFDVRDQPQGNTVAAKSLLPAAGKPTAKNLTLSPSSVAPGAIVTIAVDVAKAVAPMHDDPLSEEIIAAEPTMNWAAVLDPPSPGKQGTAFPDGHYSKTFAAPSARGVYTYSLLVSSEGCVTSDRVTATLTVQ